MTPVSRLSPTVGAAFARALPFLDTHEMETFPMTTRLLLMMSSRDRQAFAAADVKTMERSRGKPIPHTKATDDCNPFIVHTAKTIVTMSSGISDSLYVLFAE
jgi:hypothetical protein